MLDTNYDHILFNTSCLYKNLTLLTPATVGSATGSIFCLFPASPNVLPSNASHASSSDLSTPLHGAPCRGLFYSVC